MGLLKTVGNAIGNTVKVIAGNVGNAALSGAGGALQDVFYREYFESGSMAGNIIMKRGERILDGKRNSNTGGNQNVITSGALVDVQVNQCMIIVDNGAIVELCTEPGRYVFDNSSAPSFFCGNYKGLGDSIKGFFNEATQRFLNGGGRVSTQRIYYINMGKIWDPITWGTGNITFRNCYRPGAHTNPIIDIITLRGHGTCEIKVGNPLVFYSEIGAQLAGGDNNGVITTEDAGIMRSAKGTINSAIARAFSSFSNEAEIDYSAVGMYLDEITERINAQLDSTLGKRGLKVFEFIIDGTLEPNDEDKKKLSESYAQFKEAAFFATNQQDMANYNLQKSAIKNFEGIGKNEGIGGSGGAGMTMFGMGLGMNAMGVGMGQVGNLQYAQNQQPQQPQQPVQQYQQPQQPAQPTWACACGHNNTGKFCVNCGAGMPDANNAQTSAQTGWTCQCGANNTGKFCSNCGSKKPAVKKYQCDKCGWKPADGKPVRFCPECGDIFNDSDVIEE